MSRIHLTAALALLLIAPTAMAATECAGPDVAIEAKAAQRWPTALEVVRKHVAALEGVDRCARIDLVAGGSELVVVVTLRDGRTALRRAARVEDLADAVDALLLVPDAPKEVVEAPAPKTVKEPEVVAAPVTQAPIVSAPITLPTPAPLFEVGLGGSGRIGGAPFHGQAAIGAFAYLLHGRFRVGVSARSDVLDAPVRSVETSSAALGLVAGQRFHAGKMDLDLLAGVALVAQEQKMHDVRGKENDISPRVAATFRASPSMGALRPWIAIEGELGRPRSDGPAAPFVDWPFWSAGLGIGVSWSPL